MHNFDAELLNIYAWNIHGLNTNKFNDNNLQQLFVDAHFVFLSETLCSPDTITEMRGFNKIVLCRPKCKINNRFYGGNVLYYKEEIRKGLKFFPHSSNDYLWVELCPKFFKLNSPVYICFNYIPPESSQFYKRRGLDTLECITSDIINCSRSGNIMLIGDMNARTGHKADFIEHDSESDTDDRFYITDRDIPKRYTEDAKVCARGERVLDMCISSQMRILNGRTIGDSLGRYTCHNIHGSSLIDYCIVSEVLLHNIPFFKVGDIALDISDHCYINLSLKCSYKKESSTTHTVKCFPEQFVWNTSSIYSFQQGLASVESQNEIKKFENTSFNLTRESINQAVASFTKIIYDTAGKSLTKKKQKLSNCSGKHASTQRRLNSKTWYTVDLARLKKNVTQNGRMFQKHPNSTCIRTNYFKAVKNYKKACKQQKRNHIQGILDELERLQGSNPTAYWSIVNKLQGQSKKSENASISAGSWFEHFSKLNEDKGKGTPSRQLLISELAKLEENQCGSDIDQDIEETEIIVALKQMKNKKAPGLDYISSEMLKYGQSFLITPLKKLFNLIFKSRIYPKIWAQGYIVPVHKTDSILDPNNYRGITITSACGKLFNLVMNNRIQKYMSEQNVIKEEQIGFEKGKRTSDHMFALRALIDKYLNSKQTLYGVFVYFKKAFDSVIHVGMLLKLYKAGIRGNIYYLVKDMYLNVRPLLQVKVDNFLTDSFISEIGVRQGDIMSPNLFKLFVNDLSDNFNAECEPVILGNTKLNCLLYADDLIMLSESREGLQNCMDHLETYCDKWEMQVNLSKTKMVTFAKPDLTRKDTQITFGNQIIDSVSEYKYLGIVFSADGKFQSACADRKEKGMKAAFKLMRIFKETSVGIKTGLHLFDHIVKPILLYGSEIWCSPDKTFEKNMQSRLYNKGIKCDVEKVPLMFYRYMLGVSNRTALLGIYGEMGRFPLFIEALLSILKYYCRLVSTENGLLQNALLGNQELLNCGKPTWLKIVKNLLHSVGKDLRSIRGNERQIIKTVSDKLYTSFKSEWTKLLNSDSRTDGISGNKLRTYRTFKESFGQEEYLGLVQNKAKRRTLTKLRLSDHKLHIETGRHVSLPNRLPASQRLCQFCCLGNVEDEAHFLMECPLYERERLKLLNLVNNLYPSVANLNVKQKTSWLLGCPFKDVVLALTNYIYKSFKDRENVVKSSNK